MDRKILEHKSLEEQVEILLNEVNRAENSDYLTGLASRRGLYEYYTNRDKDKSVHVMFIEVNNFKKVNDVYGYYAGDDVLIQVGRMLREIGKGFAARTEGNEFIVMLDGDMSEKEVIIIADMIFSALNDMDIRKDILSFISLNIGVVLNQKVTESFVEVFHKGDTVLHQAKHVSDGRFALYHEADKVVERNRNIELEMESALENREFHVYLQPKVNMVSSKLYGAEALCRWIHPVDGLRSPAVFIPVFEKNGFISKLDMYMFEEICSLKAQWKKQGAPYGNLPISVNMSRLHLYNKKFPETLAFIADEYDIDHNELEIEITENVFVKDGNELIDNVERLKALGFQVSIDDFGSGFSALNLLKDLAVDTIKIDQSFLHGSGETVRGKKVIRNIIAMCLDLKLDVVTEGIETKEQVDFIKQCGCQIAQGFYYARPLCIDDFTAFAEEHLVHTLNSYRFPLNGDLKSEDGSMEMFINGEGLEYQEGIFVDSKAMHFPGGPKEKNTLFVPPESIVNESFTVGMWFNADILEYWVCAMYIKFESGFLSILPYSWEEEGISDVRIRDSRVVEGWYDIRTAPVSEKKWYYYVVSYDAKKETAKAYINGKLAGVLENVPTNRYVKWIILGGDVFQPSFIGRICEFTVYNEVKDEKFVNELYESYVTDEKFIGNK
ncbi:MAG: EAL domain-containing protein [Lachnospiraceae bacterium]|nr:EAL domain-containing protein [Lachnospiraceae bacterium]